jgi:FKBP-type peptidyl-prolyl cis-trans isomerase
MSNVKRTAIIFIALLFLVTSVAFSIFVFIDLTRNDSESSNQSNLTEIDGQENAQQNETNEQEQAVLKGTTLENFEPRGAASELEVKDIATGDGVEATADSTVTAHYTGAYAVNGEIFESSLDTGQPATFPLSQVIQGWQEGVPGMKVGGTRRLVIPGPLAYGEAPEGYQPGDGQRPLGTLVFDITLVAVE